MAQLNDKAMSCIILIFIAAVFALAGFVKGLIGIGLPMISMGLLANLMPPLQAAAIIILPSLVTNVWQVTAGPMTMRLIRRLWPMLVAVCLGTWAGLGSMTGATARFGTVLLGMVLVVHAISSLLAIRCSLPRNWEPILSPFIGAITGLITAATGVFSIPAISYLQSIGLEKEELVQALGLSFTTSTIAFTINVVVEGGLRLSMASETFTALVAACAGMWLGQSLRLQMSVVMFQRFFFVSLLVLGLYLTVGSSQ